MLKKLYKYEFAWMLPRVAIAWIIVFALAIISLVAQNVYDSIRESIADSEILPTLFAVTVVCFSGLFVAAQIFCIVFCFALSAVRFYKNLYSSEGYFTLCTPIKPSAHVICKFAVTFVCLVGSLALCTVANLMRFSKVERITEVFYFLLSMIADTPSYSAYLVESVIVLAFYFVFSVSELYLAISFGQGFKNKKLGAVVSFFIVSLIVGAARSVLSSIESALLSPLLFDATETYMHITLCLSALFNAGLAIGAFAIVIYRLKNKVNLE